MSYLYKTITTKKNKNMNTTINISKKEQKIINGMLSATKKKFDTLRNDLNNNISVKDFMQKYDICEMRGGEYQPNTFRVKFDYRFRAFVQIIGNSINFISVCNREGAYK
jgi:hypothetical protein